MKNGDKRYGLPNGKRYRFVQILHACARELGLSGDSGKRRVANELRQKFPELQSKSQTMAVVCGAKLLFDRPDFTMEHPSRSRRPKLPRETDIWIPREEYLSFYETREWQELRYVALKRSNGRCECCGLSPKDGAVFHVDHIKPRAARPDLQSDVDNLQVLCEDCNLGKGAWDDTDWRDSPST